MPKKVSRKRVTRKKKVLTKGQKQQVRKIIRSEQETRMYNTSSATQTTYTAAFIDLAAPPQGDAGLGYRDGDVIMPTALRFSYRVVRDSGVTASTLDTVRVMIIQWHPNTSISGTPSLSNVLQSTGATDLSESPYVLARAERKMFTVLYDKVHRNLTERAQGRDAASSGFFFRRLKGKISFDFGATTGRNKLYLIVAGQQSSAVEDSVIAYNSCLWYKDS